MVDYYITSINLIVLIVVTGLSLAYRRFWCRICPLGGLVGLLSTFPPFKQIAMTRLKKNRQNAPIVAFVNVLVQPKLQLCMRKKTGT